MFGLLLLLVKMDDIAEDGQGLPVIAARLFTDQGLGSEDGKRPSDDFYEGSKAFDLLLQVYHHFFPRAWSLFCLCSTGLE